MTNEQRNYLLNDPAQGYRAVINGCQDAILVAPTGDIIATFTHMDDAIHTAEMLNTQHESAEALAKAASMLGHMRHALDTLICDALEAINAAPGRKVIKAADGVGQS